MMNVLWVLAALLLVCGLLILESVRGDEVVAWLIPPALTVLAVVGTAYAFGRQWALLVSAIVAASIALSVIVYLITS